MRFLILLLIAGMVSAAVESFTLDDGRTFVGEYDAAEQRLYTSIAGKPTSLLVSADQIVERRAPGAVKPAAPEAINLVPGTAAAPTVEAPKPMTPEEKRAAEQAYARSLKVKAADELEAEARKAKRQAAEALSDSVRKTKEAKRHWAAFVARAKSEGGRMSGEPSAEVVILPKSGGNSSATANALAEAAKLEAQAAEYEATASRKTAEAAALRKAAGTP